MPDLIEVPFTTHNQRGVPVSVPNEGDKVRADSVEPGEYIWVTGAAHYVRVTGAKVSRGYVRLTLAISGAVQLRPDVMVYRLQERR